MRLSVVTSLYKSASYLKEFHRRMAAAAAAVTPDFEIVYVDDGSPDDSANVVKQLMREHPAIQAKLVGLSRNYGHHPALMTGLEHAKGDLVFLIDCDLEEPPELLGDCYQRLQASANEAPPVDIVYTVQDTRKGSGFERLGGSLFYKAFNALSKASLPPDALMARLMTRRYAAGVTAHGEREVFIDGIMVLAGFRQTTIPAVKMNKGSTTYTLTRRISLAVDAVTSFSDRPLIGIFLVGMAISFLAFLGVLYILSRVVIFGTDYLSGWPSLIVTIWFFGGMILVSIGIVGLYLARIFVEVKQRPRVIREISSNYEKS